jgi:hypothetical protein
MSIRNRDLAALADLPRSELAVLWKSHYGTAPPRGISRRLLIGAIAYAQQAKEQGGISPRLSRRLAKLAASGSIDAAVSPNPRKPSRAISPGTRLVREWNGITHVVDVIDDGFVWKEEKYRSLTAVARAITGARWSGPRFFGIGP